MTTGKTIVLIRQTFVGKVISLIFNMLSRFVITFLPRSKHLLISWLPSSSAVILEPKKRKPLTVQSVSSKSTVFVAQFREPRNAFHQMLSIPLGSGEQPKEWEGLGARLHLLLRFHCASHPSWRTTSITTNSILYLMAFKKTELSSFLDAKCL